MKAAGTQSLFQLSFPLFLQSLVMFAVMVADMMIWSAHSPQTAAALSVAGQVLRVVMELSAVMGIGAVIVISQQLGRGEHAAARRTAEVACLANAIIGVGLGVVLALVGPLFLRLMHLDAGVAQPAALYLRLAGAAMGFLCFGNAAVACLRGFGRSRMVLALGLFGAALYLLLEFTLVLGADPIPAMGVAGAGLANLVMRLVVALVLAAVVARELGLRFRLCRLRARGRQVWRLAALALPSVSDFIAYGIYQIVLLGVIATQGEVAVLSRAYVLIAMSFLTLVIMAVCQGSEVLIGYHLGGGRAVRRQGWQSAMIAAVLAGGLAFAIYLLAGPFIGLFSSDPAVHALSRELLWLNVFLQPCFAVNMILFHALRATEDVRWPVIVSQSLSWGFGLPLAIFLFGLGEMGVAGVWLALVVEELAKALAMIWRWSTRDRQRMQVSA